MIGASFAFSIILDKLKEVCIMSIINIFKALFGKKEIVNTENNTSSIDTISKDAPSIVEEIVSSLRSSDSIGYNIFMELSFALEDINHDNNYTEVIKVFDAAFKKLDNEWNEQNAIWEEQYNEENWPDVAHSLVWRILENKSEGVTPIDWTMKDYFGDPINEKFEAYHMDSETWEILKLYIGDSVGNQEGYRYECVLDPKISEINYPYCDCKEVSSTDTVRGNHIDSNCDTWGTSYGSRAEGLYALFISDLKKFAVVYESYWVY